MVLTFGRKIGAWEISRLTDTENNLGLRPTGIQHVPTNLQNQLHAVISYLFSLVTILLPVGKQTEINGDKEGYVNKATPGTS